MYILQEILQSPGVLSIPLEGGVVAISTEDVSARMRGLVSDLVSADLCFQWSTAVNELAGAVIRTAEELKSEEYLKGVCTAGMTVWNPRRVAPPSSDAVQIYKGVMSCVQVHNKIHLFLF